MIWWTTFPWLYLLACNFKIFWLLLTPKCVVEKFFLPETLAFVRGKPGWRRQKAMPPGPCMMDGCDQPGKLRYPFPSPSEPNPTRLGQIPPCLVVFFFCRCPVCKAEGVSFRICSQDCLNRGWSGHKKIHREAPCMVPGCDKPVKPACLRLQTPHMSRYITFSGNQTLPCL